MAATSVETLNRLASRLARSLIIEESLLAQAPGEKEYVTALAQDRQTEAQILHALNRHDEARSSYRKSIALFETLADDPARWAELAVARLTYADWLVTSGDAKPAREQLDRCYQELQTLAEIPPPGPIAPESLGGCFQELSAAFRRLGDEHRSDEIARFSRTVQRLRPPPGPEFHGPGGGPPGRPPPPPGRW